MPTASAETLMRQATHTADYYLEQAIHYIDDRFGAGYAYDHPELVAAFMRTCAADFETAKLCD
jgi:hypothetical protein